MYKFRDNDKRDIAIVRKSKKSFSDRYFLNVVSDSDLLPCIALTIALDACWNAISN